MAMTISFSILVVVCEDTIDILHARDSVLLNKLKKRPYFDYLEEDLDSLGIKITDLDKFIEDIRSPHNKVKLEQEGWRFSVKRKVKISKESA